MEDQEKIHQIFNDGGTLFLIERTDTDEFWYRKHDFSGLVHGEETPLVNEQNWTKSMHLMTLTGAFLTREEAEGRLPILEGGCGMCGNGDKEVPCIVTEHEFVPQPKNK